VAGRGKPGALTPIGGSSLFRGKYSGKIGDMWDIAVVRGQSPKSGKIYAQKCGKKTVLSHLSFPNFMALLAVLETC